jgi:hypothetical protein
LSEFVPAAHPEEQHVAPHQVATAPLRADGMATPHDGPHVVEELAGHARPSTPRLFRAGRRERIDIAFEQIYPYQPPISTYQTEWLNTRV